MHVHRCGAMCCGGGQDCWWVVVGWRGQVTMCDNGHCDLACWYWNICVRLDGLVVCCLAMFSTNDVGNSSSKPICSHPSNPLHFVMRKLMRYVLKYYRIHNLILVCSILNWGRQKCQKCAALAQFEDCLHIFTSSFHQSCSICFFHYKSL